MKRITLVAALAAIALLVTAASALAREVYVPAYQEDAVFVVDSATGQQLGAPIPTGSESAPFTLAISPDGSTVYVTNEGKDRVDLIDTRTKTVVGSIAVGENPFGIAITPDGSRAFVSNPGDGTVSAIDLATRQAIGAPIPVGPDSFGIAITPDGSRVFVPSSGDNNVTVIDALTLQKIGAPIQIGANPYSLAITPDGSRVLVAANDEESIWPIDAKTLQAGTPIPVGKDPSGVAVSPNGQRAYTGNHGSDTVSVIDLSANQTIASIPGFSQPEFVAVMPSGVAAFVSDENGAARIDLGSNLLTGPVGLPMEGAGHLAIVPNQSPVAGLTLPSARVRPGVAASFSGASSSDPDGAVAGYAWSFAGAAPQTAGTVVKHTFAKPGKVKVTLTVSDDEGCSVATVFTGQTASCNGNPAATITKTVTVAYPGVKAKCPKSAKLGCKVRLVAVKWQGKGKQRRLVPLSALAKTKLKAGGSKAVSLKPKKSARTKLAKAKRILVAESRVAKKSRGTATLRLRVAKLRVVQ